VKFKIEKADNIKNTFLVNL